MMIGYISLACAGLYLLATLGLQFLAVLARDYEPEGMFLSLILGFPFFVAGTVTSIVGLFSKVPKSKKLCIISLLILWLPIILLFLLGLAMLTPSIIYAIDPKNHIP
jgi:hypothetical protein